MTRGVSILLFFTLVRRITGSEELVSRVYSSVDATEYVGSITHQGNKTILGGVDYISIIDRTSNAVNVTQLIPPLNPFCTKDEQCQKNAMQVIDTWNSTTVFACGTYAYNPKCFFINLQDLSHSEVPDQQYDYFVNHRPGNTNPTLIVQSSEGPVLYASACTSSSRGCNFQRQTTKRKSVKRSGNHFDRPNFLNIYESRERVYTFYRDYSTAIQYDDFMADGQRNEYGFVARVCANDPGGVNRYVFNWITFVQARLLCPFPGGSSVGSSNTYYDVMTSTYKVGEMVYAVFTLPSSRGFSTSAVCVYNLQEIDTYFNGRKFPNNVTLFYTPRRSSIKNPFHHGRPYLPGQCLDEVANPRRINDEFENFITETTLVASSIPPVTETPSFRSLTHVFKHVAAFQVGGHHIVCAFTDTGYMAKVRNNASTGAEPKTLFETQIPDMNGKIKTVSVVGQKILLVTKTQVVEVSPIKCSLHSNCTKCEADPHCDWLRREKHFECVIANQSEPLSVDICQAAPNTPSNFTLLTFDYPTLSTSWQGKAPSYYVVIRRKKNDVTEYEGFYSDNNFKVSADRTNADLKRGVDYVLNVYALRGNTQSRDPLQGQFKRDLETPQLRVENIETSAALLSWDFVRDAISYSIKVHGTENTLFAEFTVSPAERTTLKLTKLSPTSTYNATICAISADGTPSATNTSTFITAATKTTAVSPSYKPYNRTNQQTVVQDQPTTHPSSSARSALTAGKDSIEITSTATEMPSQSFTKDKVDNSQTATVVDDSIEAQKTMTTTRVVFTHSERREVFAVPPHSLGSTKLVAAGTTNKIVWYVVIGCLAFIALLVLSILLFNNRNIGMSTKEIKAEGIVLRRKCFFWWVPSGGSTVAGYRGPCKDDDV